MSSSEYVARLEDAIDCAGAREDEELVTVRVGDIRAVLDALAAASPSTPRLGGEPFQDRVQQWVLACFGEDVAADKLERADRFTEEALELVQALGYSADRAHALVEYVFGRPVGEPHQEAGGVMVTLATLLKVHSIDMAEAGEAELARVWTKVDAIRAKQAAKPVGSALPVPVASPTSGENGVREALEKIRALALAQRDYWNGDRNDAAMYDACERSIDYAVEINEVALAALSASPARGE